MEFRNAANPGARIRRLPSRFQRWKDAQLTERAMQLNTGLITIAEFLEVTHKLYRVPGENNDLMVR